MDDLIGNLYIHRDTLFLCYDQSFDDLYEEILYAFYAVDADGHVYKGLRYNLYFVSQYLTKVS